MNFLGGVSVKLQATILQNMLAEILMYQISDAADLRHRFNYPKYEPINFHGETMWQCPLNDSKNIETYDGFTQTGKL